MKNKLFFSTLVFLATTLSISSFAEAKRKTRVDAMETSEVSASAGTSRMGFGFATYGSGIAAPSGGPAVSFWMDFTNRLSLQPFFTIESSSPFAFTVGSILRHTLLGGMTNGLHMGLGFSLGTGVAGVGPGTSFFCNIFPVMGFHFNILNNVALSFDGGPVFHVTPSPFQFSTAPFGTTGGASIHYFF